MQSLTLGKLRHLQQISNEFGMFTIAALDHRGSLSDIVNYRGTPWRERVPDEKLPTLKEGWYAEY